MEQIIKHTRYVDPMVDVAFKQIFGKEKNKRLIKELLEHVFHQDITELEFVNVEHPGESKDDRKAVFDLQCNSRQLGDFIVEVQVKAQAHFDKRALYYSTFPITAQAPRGDWDYDFRPVFFLGILNCRMEGPSGHGGNGGYIHRYSIREESTGLRLTDALQFVFMELDAFDKRLQDCNGFVDKFLYYFKNLPNFVIKPDTQQDSYFEELLAAAEYSNMTKAEREAYNRRLKIQRDNYAADKYAREKLQQQLEKQRELEKKQQELEEQQLELEKQQQELEKKQQEQEEARATILSEGRAEANRNNALKMLQEGLPLELIERVTGLNEEELDKLK